MDWVKDFFLSDWVKPLLDTIAVIIFAIVFAPGLVAFLSIRHAICSFIAVIVAWVVTKLISITYRNGAGFDPYSLPDMLTVFFSMTVCFTFCWAVMHFVLPKTFLSNVSKKVRGVVGVATLLVIGALMVLRSHYSH